MGFFSWNCSVCDKSIPHDYNHLIHLVLPDDRVISGYYNGYGCITREECTDSPEYDIYVEVGTVIGIVKDRDRVMAFLQTYKYKDFSIGISNWEVVPVEQSIGFIKGCDEIAGKTFNQLKSEGIGEFISNMEIIHKSVKIVADRYYTGQKFSELSVSKSCKF